MARNHEAEFWCIHNVLGGSNSSASPLLKGERTEVRGHGAHNFKQNNPHPALSLAKGEAKRGAKHKAHPFPKNSKIASQT
jgi:hypothetical protein